ncbi:MAG: type II/IV secretion system ATPase subunit, partial [Nanoarchaeota archaeon]|nr:type II/IV secretion system ATPase subunit [Nanoarchaeota archaeon]
ADVTIRRVPGMSVPQYFVNLPNIDEGTYALLKSLRIELIREIPEKIQQLSTGGTDQQKQEFLDLVITKLQSLLPNLTEETYRSLAGTLFHEMFGLGEIEVIDSDDNLEDIVVNNSKTNVLVYHRKFGWLETNLRIDEEEKIENYAEQIARRVGRQITILNPLLDAQLLNGDRVNATLFPISTKGNTIDIRKFRAEPWTLVDFLQNKTISAEAAAFLWQAIEYELSFIVTGGTASGKTSLLNVLIGFIPPNQRIITIEDTEELVLPKFLHWVPLLTRQPNAEGKGEVTMLDLLVNSLRMRPDRLVVGEIRRREEAETLFEALMTGHSVYATMHAETAQQIVNRLLSDPINLPEIEVASLDLIVTAFRQRRLGIRRVLEVAEVEEAMSAGKVELRVNNLFQWKARTDTIEKSLSPSVKVQSKIELYSGLTASEIQDDLNQKLKVLNWMVRHKLPNLESIGLVLNDYYIFKDRLLDAVEKDLDFQAVQRL